MLFLALSIFSSVTFLQILRTGQQRKTDQMILIWANYAVAAVLSFVLILTSGNGLHGIDWPILGAGVANGTLYVVHLLIVIATVRLAGTGVTSAIMGSGGIVAVLIAWGVWGETLSPWQWGAVAIMPVGLLLMRTRSGPQFKHSWRTDGILVANFTMVGVIATIHKGISLSYSYHGRLMYQLVLFIAALTLTTIVVIKNGRRPSRTEIVLGTVAGVANFVSALFLLFALSVLLAVIVFPTKSSLSILLSLALGWILWRESLTKRQLIGCSLAIVTVVLANIP